MTQLDLFDLLATDDEIRTWARTTGWDGCPTTGPIPDSLREAHAARLQPPPEPPGPFICRWCHREERTAWALSNNHWTPGRADHCIAMDLTRNHVIYFARILAGTHTPPGCFSASCRHRSPAEACVREQLERTIRRVVEVWPADRLDWLHTLLTAAGLGPDVVDEFVVIAA